MFQEKGEKLRVFKISATPTAKEYLGNKQHSKYEDMDAFEYFSVSNSHIDEMKRPGEFLGSSCNKRNSLVSKLRMSLLNSDVSKILFFSRFILL